MDTVLYRLPVWLKLSVQLQSYYQKLLLLIMLSIKLFICFYEDLGENTSSVEVKRVKATHVYGILEKLVLVKKQTQFLL